MATIIKTEKGEAKAEPRITPKKEAIFSNKKQDIRLLNKVSSGKTGFEQIRKSLFHKAMDYYILIGNPVSPFPSIHGSTKKFDLTFSHGIKLINTWQELGLLEKVKPKGSRCTKLVFTKKGIRVRNSLVKIQEALINAKHNFPKVIKELKVKRGIA